ncbi:uncharacterized protein LOC122957725 [Acropora millepora]|uniref:uncharacterized protein LOC122957725 n=1 Tax=Acropora millepora TaxID=45264 RepID=UPI001CF2D817|nr:uncharacterized protein LOC122957725 [Acropora millepora]
MFRHIWRRIVVGKNYRERGRTSATNEASAAWIDKGYVKPEHEVKTEGIAILDAENYGGFKDLDLNMAKLHFEHELPKGYSIVKRIGHGAFGCCFLVEKQGADPQRPHTIPNSNNPCRVVLKVVHGMINPRRPVVFYKTCSLYTLMISFEAIPLIIENLDFIVGMLKFLHTKHAEVHGDLNPGNMMYFVKDVTREFLRNMDLWYRFDGETVGGLRRGVLPETWKEWPQATQIFVLYDFLDHWFPMEDEHCTTIIDADIGGKIGQPKIVVNHQHHDPRNATWQVSDDIVGLMNWVVIETGHHLQSHASRGIAYDITLESLRELHTHIVDIYERVESRFIFKHWMAPQTHFKLKLMQGECYLDELLEGSFLNFKSFKGSYSLASTTATVTSCVKFEGLEVTQAEPVTLKEICCIFSKVASNKAKYLPTLNMVLNLLTSPSLGGGVVFVVLDKKYKDDLQLLSLDETVLTQLCRHKAKEVDNPLFKDLLDAFCTHTESDRWELSLLEKLALKCANRSLEMSPTLAKLENQPKDGAFVLSCSGTILAAAAQLKFVPQHYQLCKADGISFGTRHAAALATAEWMRLKGIDGVVFVRSSEGELHVMLPHGQTLSECQECPWIAKDGQKLPQVLLIEEEK